MDDQDRYWPQPIGSLTGSEVAKLPPATSQDQAARDRLSWIAAKARQVLAAYRRDDFADPDSYLLQLGVVLERFDDKIIEAVTSPLTGIQRECKFPPSIAEFVEFCNETQRRMNWASSYDARSRQQLAQREQQQSQETPEQRAAAVERCFAEMRRCGGDFQRLGSAAAKIIDQSSSSACFGVR